jgi:hypothetical protein
MDKVARVGLVIPTLFSRDDYLRDCIQSVRASGDVYILLMGPKLGTWQEFTPMIDEFLEEPQLPSLTAKLNAAMRALPAELSFITWLGDDDLLEPGSMKRAARALQTDSTLAFVYGGCKYIDSRGNQLGINNSGQWATTLMKFGPFLIPQPGSLIRRSHFEVVDGLSPNFDLAFDYDLVARLKRVGRIHFLGAVQASYRWHADALSVGQRGKSAREAARVREVNSGGFVKLVTIVLNPVVALLTLAAGWFVSRRENTEAS